MRRITQGTMYAVTWKMFLSSDHVSPAIGVVPTLAISKNGDAFAPPEGLTGAINPISNGWFVFTLAIADTDTPGDLIFRATEATCDPSEQIIQIVPLISAPLQLTDLVEPDWTVQDVMKMTLAALAGPTAFDPSGVIFSNPAQTKNRITSAVDETGNRSDMTYDKT